LVITACQIPHKTRVTHQIANGLRQIALRTQAKMKGCRLVAPLNAGIGIQQDDTIGRHLQRR